MPLLYWTEWTMMNQKVEIEFKNMLTSEEFQNVISYFKIKEQDFKKQENFYFDTSSFILAKHSSALRIRSKNDSYELTLKQPHPDGMLESNLSLTKNEAKAFIDKRQLPDSAKYMRELLASLKVKPSDLKLLGSLTTSRCEIDYKDGLLSIDHNFYLGKEDYELEYEANDKQTGKMIFSQLLEELHITQKPAKNKILRFFEAKYQKLC